MLKRLEKEKENLIKERVLKKKVKYILFFLFVLFPSISEIRDEKEKEKQRERKNKNKMFLIQKQKLK